MSKRYLWKKNFAAENSNLYRGPIPIDLSSPAKNRQGFEIGPDIARNHDGYDTTADILQEPTPLLSLSIYQEIGYRHVELLLIYGEYWKKVTMFNFKVIGY